VSDRHRTPPPVTEPFGVPLDGPINGATAARIAKQTTDAEIPYHELHCSRAAKLETRLNDMENAQKINTAYINQLKGERKFQRYFVPLLVGFLGSSVAAVFVALLVGLVFPHLRAGSR
jgi:hypothetical protein